MDDEEEFRALEDAFKLLSPDERQRLYAERKAHKEVVVFLHEWGHSVGLLHDDDRALIMNPSYDERQRTFSDFDKEVLALVIERRLARRSELYPESADLLSLYEKAPTDEGSDQERADTAAALASATGIIRSEVGKQLGLRHTPSLAFVADDIPQTVQRIEDLVSQAMQADAELARSRVGAVPAGDPDPYRKPAEDDEDDPDE